MALNETPERTFSFGDPVSRMVPNEGSAMDAPKLAFGFWSKIALLKVPCGRVHCDDKNRFLPFF